MLVSAAVIHIVSAAVLCLILAGIAAGVLGLVLGLILTGVAAGVLSTVFLRIHGIRSMAVSAVVHITVMISHNDSLLFGLVNLLRD